MTTVPVERTRAEIERMLVGYKATKFATLWSETGTIIVFEMSDRRIRFNLDMPDKKDFELDPRSTYKKRSASRTQSVYDQECRRRWRALALVIKAKLEAVETGITTLEQEFLAHIVLPNNATVGEWAAEQLQRSYMTGKMPPLLSA